MRAETRLGWGQSVDDLSPIGQPRSDSSGHTARWSAGHALTLPSHKRTFTPTMRSFLAGLFALWLLSSGAMAQVTGFVESVGLGGGAGGGGVIRPDRWTPMRVHLSSHVSTPEHYQLQVWQDDLGKFKRDNSELICGRRKCVS